MTTFARAFVLPESVTSGRLVISDETLNESGGIPLSSVTLSVHVATFPTTSVAVTVTVLPEF